MKRMVAATLSMAVGSAGNALRPNGHYVFDGLISCEEIDKMWMELMPIVGHTGASTAEYAVVWCWIDLCYGQVLPSLVFASQHIA